MKTKPSPRPWYTANFNNGIVDANNETVVANIHYADAALIVDAVNHMDYDLSIRYELNDARAEIDELRDIVRRLLPLAETTVENIRALGAARFPFEEHIKSDRLRGDINREVANADHLLREARAAIGKKRFAGESGENKEKTNARQTNTRNHDIRTGARSAQSRQNGLPHRI